MSWNSLSWFGAILLLTIPLCWMAERLVPKRRDWLLSANDFYEGVFWMAAGYIIWVPLYERFYDSPIADYFTGLRESLGFSLTFEATSIPGLLVVAVIAARVIEFIGYWAHRLQQALPVPVADPRHASSHHQDEYCPG